MTGCKNVTHGMSGESLMLRRTSKEHVCSSIVCSMHLSSSLHFQHRPGSGVQERVSHAALEHTQSIHCTNLLYQLHMTV
jgi:hypothetical protein